MTTSGTREVEATFDRLPVLAGRLPSKICARLSQSGWFGIVELPSLLPSELSSELCELSSVSVTGAGVVEHEADRSVLEREPRLP